MHEIETLALVGATFFLAGAVKGVVGLGLPTVSLAVLTATIGLPQAMALLLAPSLATNLWQALAGGHGRAVLRRTWPFLALATGTVWIGALALTRIDVALLSAMLGALLILYAAMSLTGVKIVVPPGREVWAGPALGTINGLLTGMTGSFVVPGVLYLQAIGLGRDMLIQAMGMLFAASALALAVALGGNGLLTAELGLASILAILPAVAGMIAGQHLRKRMPDALFRRVFFLSLLALGGYIVLRSMM
ncbi:sulfite exporter TauE/SafE family protein [Inquilinus sp. CAU 1745]|uniref:sulfite exporter TauE/SafE family protein n=1 Tax=Inquilinus sp. CAU 1745 TaxID=3140369 RepID=UPI00325AFED7